MRHQKNTVKLGRTTSHRDALLANQVCSLIEHTRITTTLAKAKAVRPLAEKLVTLGKKGTLHARRVALAYLHHNEDAVRKLFTEIAPRSANRNGGYTRIIKKGPRLSDASAMAFIEWVDQATPEVKETEVKVEAKAEPKTEAKAEVAEVKAKKAAAPKTAKKASTEKAAAKPKAKKKAEAADSEEKKA